MIVAFGKIGIGAPIFDPSAVPLAVDVASIILTLANSSDEHNSRCREDD